MAPKSALLTAGTTSYEKAHAPAFPLTTQDKILKAKANKQKATKNVPRSPPPAKRTKPTSLPPPAESAMLARSKLEAAGKRKDSGWGSKKPLTTQQKIAAAKAAAKAKDPYSAAKKEAAAAKSGDGKGKKKEAGKRAEKAKAPGTLSVLGMHHATSKKYSKPDEGVLFRRTQRSEMVLRDRREKEFKKDPELRKVWEVLQKAKTNGGLGWKQKLGEDAKMREKVKQLVDAGAIPAPGEGQGFRLLDLPKELRLEIWRLAVVETRVFIRPDSLTGREQPDLAMVNRQVRDEVLPIFYAENTFAIDISPPTLKQAHLVCGRQQWKRDLSDLRAISKWLPALEEGGWFSHIQKWVFDYAPEDAWATSRSLSTDAEDTSLMVSLRLKRRQDSQHKGWDATIEIHREASCILPGFHQKKDALCCVVKETPKWLNEAVITVVDAAANAKGVSGAMIVSLAKEVQKKAAELVEVRCEKVVGSIEG